MVTHVTVNGMTRMVVVLCHVCVNVAKPSSLQQLKGRNPVRHEEQSVHAEIFV